MKRRSVLYYVAGALALVAALVMILDNGLQEDERFRASVYILWAAIMIALGYRSQKSA